MSRNVCSEQQQHSKLLTQLCSKCPNFILTQACRMKTSAPVPDCRINNNELIQLVPSCQDTQTQFVDVSDPQLVDLLLHY